MSTRSVYILGGPGAGKSTFTSELLDAVCMFYGPLEDLHATANARGSLVTLRGHRLVPYDGEQGVYLGYLRESYPGTDGLDRASSMTGQEWLRTQELPDHILAEGATLATRPFLAALHETTELLVVHLYVDDDERSRRFEQRGSTQNATWVAGRVTGAWNRYDEALELGAAGLSVDTGDRDSWELALELSERHLLHRT